MKLSTLRAIQQKNPDFTLDQIKLIVNRYLVTISKTLDRSLVFDIKVPKFGRIHTHGNAVDKMKKVAFKAQVKCHRRTADFSDNKLLF